VQNCPAENSEVKKALSIRPLWMRALGRVFSFPVAIAGLLVLLGELTVRGRFDDPDLWWHLKMGQVIWTTHRIPLTDIFSYTTNHEHSIPQEWLSQLSIYGFYRLGGLPGLMFWLCLMTAVLLVAGYVLCSIYSGNCKVAFAGAMAIWFFGTIGFAVRPQLIGYIFLIFELILIHLARTGNARSFLLLPVLFAIWVNCHASFFLGMIVAGVYLFSSFFSFRSGSIEAPRWDPHCRRMLVLAFVLSAGVIFLNPDSAGQVLYPLNTIFHQPLALSASQEWQPTQMTDARGVGLLAVLFCIFLLVALRRSILFWDELLLISLGTWLGVSHMRTLFAFGILAVPVLTRQLSTSWDSYDAQKDRIWPNAAVIGFCILVAFLVFPSAKNLKVQVEKGSPVKAVEFLKRTHLPGPMLNDYTYGGYLIWAAPEYPDFVDGRSDVFEWSGVLQEFGQWATLQTDPSILLDKYKVNFCLLDPHSSVARILPLLTGWKAIYSDENSVIFLRTPTGANTAQESNANSLIGSR
jgi:hypothetical protein